MPEIEEVCMLMDKEDEKGAKNVKAVNYYQDFDLFNIVGVARQSEDFNCMNNFQFGNLLKSYVKNFAESIEQSDKMRSVIDNIFDNKTRKFFFKQIIVFAFMFVIPFLAHLFVGKEETAERVLLSVGLFGWMYMYSLECMSMRVEGFLKYIKNPWNIMD